MDQVINSSLAIASTLGVLVTENWARVAWLIIFLASVYMLKILTRAFRQKSIEPILEITFDGDAVEMPKVVSTTIRQDRIKIPNRESATQIICCTILVILAIFSLFKLIPTGVTIEKGDLSALQVGALSLLFPIIILILGKELIRDDALFADHEILIRHSWAYPASLALPLFSLYFVFEKYFDSPADVKSALAILSLGILIFVNYRLLEASYSSAVKNRTERELLWAKMHHYVASKFRALIALENTGTAATHPKISFDPYGFRRSLHKSDSDDVVEIPVSSRTEGTVVKIDFKKLGRIGRTLDTLHESITSQPTTNDLTQTQLDIKHSTIDAQRLALSSYVGKKVTPSERDCLLVLSIHVEYKDTPRIKRIIEESLSAFTITRDESSSTDEDVYFESICTRLSGMGKRAIDTSSINLLEKMIANYESVYLSIQSAVNQVENECQRNSNYKLSVSNPFPTTPLEAINNDLAETLIQVLRSKNLSNEFVSRFLYIPYYLGYHATSKRDALALSTFMSFGFRQLYSLEDERRPELADTVLQWNRSLVRYAINSSIKTDQDEAYKEKIIKFASWRLQHLGKIFIDQTDAKKFEDVMTILLSLGESLAEKLEDEQSNLDNYGSHFGRSVLSEEDRSVAENLIQMRWESLLGWAWYSLYRLEGAKPENDETLKRIMELSTRHLPTRFNRVLEFMVRFEQRDSADKWDWIAWERHSSGQFHPVNENYCDRIFAVLFARSKPSHKSRLDDIKGTFPRARLYKIEKPESKIRKDLNTLRSRPEASLVKTENIVPEWLEEAMDSVVSAAALNEQTRLANTPLSESKVKLAMQEFGQSYREHSLVKGVLPVQIIWDEEFDEGYFGVNQLLERDYFTESESRLLDEIMRHLGHDAGKQESLFIFNGICKSISLDEEVHDIDQAISRLIDGGSRPNDIIILTNGYHKGIRDSGRLNFQGENNQQAIYTDASGNELRIICVLGRASESKSVVVMDSNAVYVKNFLKTDEQSNIIEQTPFVFRLVDPKEDQEIRDKIVQDSPSWLIGETNEEKEIFAALRVWLRILECFKVEIATPRLIQKIDFSSDTNADD